MGRNLIESQADWRGADMARREDWVYRLTPEEIADIERAFRAARGIQLAELRKEDFPLDRFGAIAERALELLENGPGMFLLRGFPIERYATPDLRLFYWGLGKYLGTAVSQSAEGDVLGDVRDLKVDLQGPKGRGYKTNAELEFHTDSCDVTGLFVLRVAKSGGLSMIASSVAICNEIARTRPDLLEVLFRPFHWSLQQQEGAGEAPHYEQPIFTSHEGLFACRYIRTHIRSAQRFHDVPRLTPEQQEAMDLVDRLAASPEFHFSMMFEPGDLQLLNNHVALHARTRYEDSPEPERIRHLLRMWLSVPNSRPLSPFFGTIYRDQRPGAVRGGFPSRTGRLVFETTEA